MNIIRLTVSALALSTMELGACASAESPIQSEVHPITVPEILAFSATIAADPFDGKSLYNVRAITYSNPNDCFESPQCGNVKLFIVVVGDGELPDYRVYDAGDSAGWSFSRWVQLPTEFHDDARDAYVVEFKKTLPCADENCSWETRPIVLVKASVSLFGFEWLD